MDLTNLKVSLIEPKKKLKGETKSKFLEVDSDLYLHIIDCQQRLKHAGIRFESRLSPHVELISSTESLDVFLRRAKELHGLKVDVTDKSKYKVIGKTLVLELPPLSDKSVNVKIAHFSYLPPHINKLTGVIMDPNYTPFNDWEQTVFD